MIAAHAFDPMLAGRPTQLVGDNGRILPVAPQRWLAPAATMLVEAAHPGFQMADRYRAGRCFAELRYVRGR